MGGGRCAGCGSTGRSNGRSGGCYSFGSGGFFFKEGKLVLPKKESGDDKLQKNSSANNYNQYINNSLNSKPEFSDSEVRDIFEKISSESGAPDAPTSTGGASGAPQMAPPLVRE